MLSDWRFAELGHNVIGLEYIAKPIEDFFNENGISYVTEAVPGMKNATLYKVFNSWYCTLFSQDQE